MALGKLSRFERLFTSTIMGRGYDYKNSDAVKQLIAQKVAANTVASSKRQQWSATVYGSERYRVQIELMQLPDNDMSIETMVCSCPYDEAYDDYCKHLAAVLLIIRAQLQEGKVVLREHTIENINVNSVVDTDALLQSLDIPALRGFIQQCMLRQPSLLNELIIWSSAYRSKASADNDDENSHDDLRDPNVMKSMRRQIDTILAIDDRYYNDYDSYDYECEDELDEESIKFEQIFAQFVNQPLYQVACVLYWLEQLITLGDEYSDIAFDAGFHVGFAKFGQIVFGLNKTQGKIDPDYYPSWSDDLRLYTINLTNKDLLKEVEQRVKDWQALDTINETGSECQPARVAFDLYIAKQDWYPALLVLNEHIEIEKFSRHADYQLEALVMLKIALLAHLQEPAKNQKSSVNQNIADEQLGAVLTEFAYLPAIRRLLIQRAVDLGELDIAVNLLNKGVDIALEKRHAGTVSEWQKQLVDMLTSTEHLSTVSDDMTAIIRENCKALAFDRSSMIDKFYYKKWRDSYQSMEWQQVIGAEQQRLQQVINHSAQQGKRPFSNTNAEFEILAQIYALEKQTEDLVNLLKGSTNIRLLQQYHAQIIAVDTPWLIQFYTQHWAQRIEMVLTRKEYHALAQDIHQMINQLPSAIAIWQPLVNEWQIRFSENPKKPALLDELSKIRWPKS